MTKLKKRVQKLKNQSDNSPVQRTPEWFELRRTRITASDVASVLRRSGEICRNYVELFQLHGEFPINQLQYCNPYSNETEFILKKHGFKPFNGNQATEWGNKYEMAAIHFYERLKEQKVIEFGLLLHSKLDWLACSPDGITEDGVMIEIKCPWKRKLNGIPPFYYYIQVQIQLEVCGLEECDFLECTIDECTLEQWKDLKNETIFVSQHSSETRQLQSKGVCIDIGGKIHYPKNGLDCVQMIEWVHKKQSKYQNLKPVPYFYIIKEYSLVTIKRDRQWFKLAKPMIKESWDKVAKFDIEEYKQHLELEKKQGIKLDFTTNEECTLTDTDRSSDCSSDCDLTD